MITPSALRTLRQHNVSITVLFVLMPPTPARAADIPVAPGDSIQAAIGAALPGDSITVAPGTYTEVINFMGKAITLRSSGGAAVTTIDGAGINVVVTCQTGEGPGTVLEGFTITGGNGFMGGGMVNMFSSPTVRNCVFAANNGFFGGGMRNDNAAPTVQDCAFVGNTAFTGAGMSNAFASTTVTNCVFSGNIAQPMSGGEGGGIDNANSNTVITNCTFSGNQAGVGGAIHNASSSPTISNSVLWGNMALAMGNEVDSSGTGTPTFNFCAVAGSGGSVAWDGTLGTDGGGNLDLDPMFANPAGTDGTVGTVDDDLRLQNGSPAIDAGDNAAVPAGVTLDIDGQSRFLDVTAVPDTGAGGAPIVDLGAFEMLEVVDPGGDDDGGGDGGDDCEGDDCDDDGGDCDDDGCGDDDDEGDEIEPVEFGLDLFPRVCKNVLRGRGMMRVAVLGSSEVDVEAIDTESLTLRRADGEGEAIAPWKIYGRLRDVGGGDSESTRGRGCRCGDHCRDGHPDLIMKFSVMEAFKALWLGDFARGEDIELVLEGELRDGTPFYAVDVLQMGWRPGRVADFVGRWSRRHKD